MEWPRVVKEPDYEYEGPNDRLNAIADGLSAWGCCHIEKPPENFGRAMVKISKILGVNATPDVLMNLASEVA